MAPSLGYNAGMNATPHRRRWYQFSVGTVLWLMLVAALLAFGANERYKRADAEAAFKRELAQVRKQAADEQRKRHRYQNELDQVRRRVGEPK